VNVADLKKNRRSIVVVLLNNFILLQENIGQFREKCIRPVTREQWALGGPLCLPGVQEALASSESNTETRACARARTHTHTHTHTILIFLVFKKNHLNQKNIGLT
jgi:hypothetical protein